jgi:transcriptional regulator with XRE-family HTH domain
MGWQPETSPLLRAVGQRIAELRRRKDLTQEQASEALGMLASNYAHLEQGRQNLTIDTLVRVAKLLDVEVADLFARPEEPKPRKGRPKKASYGR